MEGIGKMTSSPDEKKQGKYREAQTLVRAGAACLVYKMLQFGGWAEFQIPSPVLSSPGKQESDHSLKDHLALATFILRPRTGEKVNVAFFFIHFTPK